MGLYDKLKQYLNKNNNQETIDIDDDSERQESLEQQFLLIMEKLGKFKQELEDIKSEEENLNGRKHYLRKQVEDEILELIEIDDSVLYMQDRNGFNIGMMAAGCEFVRVLDLVKDNEEINCQVNNFNGENIAMCCCFNGAPQGVIDYVKAVMKFDSVRNVLDVCENNISNYGLRYNLDDIVDESLNYHDLSTHIFTNGNNLGMMCVLNKKEKLALKALDNHKASTQQNPGGQNIGMLAATKQMESVVLKALDNKEAAVQVDVDGLNMGMIATRNYLTKAGLKALDNPEASIQQHDCGWNIGMFGAAFSNEEIVKKALENETARKQFDLCDRNIGMIAVVFGSDDMVKLCLENDDVATCQNHDGENLGMYIAIHRKINLANYPSNNFEDLGCLALDNPVAAIQKDNWGRTMGMHFALKHYRDASIKALQNKTLRYDKDKFGLGITDYLLTKNSFSHEDHKGKLSKYMFVDYDEASEDMKMVYDIAQYMYEQDKQNLEQTDSSFVDAEQFEMA